MPISGLVSGRLKEEIAAEALVANIPSFSEFLRVVAITSSELLNYTNVARASALREEQRVKRALVVSLEREPREIERGIEVVPWRTFLERLWSGDLGV